MKEIILILMMMIGLTLAQVYPGPNPYDGPATLQTPKMHLRAVGTLQYPQLDWGDNAATTTACPYVEQISMYNLSCTVPSFLQLGFLWANSSDPAQSALGYQLLDTVFAFLDSGRAVGPNNDVWGFDDPVFGNAYALLGAGNGLSVVDVTVPQSPRIVGFFEGPYSIWRDIKTRGSYAYYVQDSYQGVCRRMTNVNSSYCQKLLPTDGLSIVDLSRADSPLLVAHDTSSFSWAHNLFVEVEPSRPYAYVCGGNVGANGGVAIFDLSDPVRPRRIAEWDDVYLHDVMVQYRASERKYLLYGAAIYQQAGDEALFVFDVTDPTNPVRIGKAGRSTWPMMHNVWPTTDSEYLYVTHEGNNQPITIWDAKDPADLKELGPLWLTEGNDDISAHNVHVRGDRLFISYYSMGTVVYDISKPAKPRLLGQYDTYPQNWQNRGGLSGNWGVYPYAASRLPDGEYYVYSNDMANGLFVTQLVAGSSASGGDDDDDDDLGWFIGVSFAFFAIIFGSLAYLLYHRFAGNSSYEPIREQH